uniref:Uncharacterized protein n=1 Tax=Trichobilharzia regenti TaxID=157069 RepID=A0AA85JET1_TRIRE|nr:unnamed protein product [Trichobilharzia regenti]
MAWPGFLSFLFSLLNSLLFQNDPFLGQTGEPLTVIRTTPAPNLTQGVLVDWSRPPGTILTDCIAIRSQIIVNLTDEKNNINESTTVNAIPQDLIFLNSSYNGRYTLDSVKLTFTLNNSATENEVATDTTVFSVPVGAYFTCDDEIHKELSGENGQDVKVDIYFNNSSMEAFKLHNRAEFESHAVDCPGSKPWRYKVVLVVCTTLLATCIFVFVTYLIIRRGKQTTYEPMK